MSLFKPNLESNQYIEPLGIIIVECDICGVRFSQSMAAAWPFCTAGIPHERMKSKEQLHQKEALIAVGDTPKNDHVRAILELKSGKRKIEWLEDAPPSYPILENITLAKERYKILRDDYFIMGYFIGNVLQKYNWHMDDLLEYSMRHWEAKPTGEENEKKIG